jgi:hypothetical protein
MDIWFDNGETTNPSIVIIIIPKTEIDKDSKITINATEIVGDNEYFLLFIEYIQ